MSRPQVRHATDAPTPTWAKGRGRLRRRQSLQRVLADADRLHLTETLHRLDDCRTLVGSVLTGSRVGHPFTSTSTRCTVRAICRRKAGSAMIVTSTPFRRISRLSHSVLVLSPAIVPSAAGVVRSKATIWPVFSIRLSDPGGPQPTSVCSLGRPTIGGLGPSRSTHHWFIRCPPLPQPQSPGTPTCTPPNDSHRQPCGSVGTEAAGSRDRNGNREATRRRLEAQRSPTDARCLNAIPVTSSDQCAAESSATIRRSEAGSGSHRTPSNWRIPLAGRSSVHRPRSNFYFAGGEALKAIRRVCHANYRSNQRGLPARSPGRRQPRDRLRTGRRHRRGDLDPGGLTRANPRGSRIRPIRHPILGNRFLDTGALSRLDWKRFHPERPRDLARRRRSNHPRAGAHARTDGGSRVHRRRCA